jgi:syntaxin 1B/2/3
MQDRLGELKKLAVNNPSVTNETNGNEDIEAAATDSEFLADFRKGAREVELLIKSLQRIVEELETKYKEQLNKLDSKERKEISSEISKLNEDANTHIFQIKTKLQALAPKDENDEEEAEERLMRTTHAGLTKQFLDTMQQYFAVQDRHKKQYRRTVEQQIKIVNPEATEEEIERAIKSGEADRIFVQETINRKEAAEAALRYIKDQHDEIVKIEQGLLELKQLFVDMEALVQEQSEWINSIQANIDKTVAYTGKAVDELKKANRYAGKARKKMIIIIILLIVVAGVVVAVVLGVLHPGTS